MKRSDIEGIDNGILFFISSTTFKRYRITYALILGWQEQNVEVINLKSIAGEETCLQVHLLLLFVFVLKLATKVVHFDLVIGQQSI